MEEAERLIRIHICQGAVSTADTGSSRVGLGIEATVKRFFLSALALLRLGTRLLCFLFVSMPDGHLIYTLL